MAEETRPQCPHCGREMDKWAVPDNSTWPDDYHYVCFNDECGYYVNGWVYIEEQRGVKASYRHMCKPDGSGGAPLPVPTPEAGRGRIIKD